MAFIHLALGMSHEHIESSWLGLLVGLLDGRPATVFMVLAGMGISLRLRAGITDERVRAAVVTLRRRGLFFLAVGYLNLIWWQGDILRVYGIGYIAVTWLLLSSTARLWQVAAGIVVSFLVMMVAFDYERNWDWESMYYENLWTLSGGMHELFFNGFRSVFPWLAFMLVGMVLGRCDLNSRKFLARVGLLGALVWIGTEALSAISVSYLRAHPQGMEDEVIVALAGTTSMPPLPFFMLSSGGVAVAFICLCIFTIDIARPGNVFQPLVAAGQMAFTWYILHILVCLMLETMTHGEFPPWKTLMVSIGFFAATLVISYFYKRRFKLGPLEAVLRAVG